MSKPAIYLVAYCGDFFEFRVLLRWVWCALRLKAAVTSNMYSPLQIGNIALNIERWKSSFPIKRRPVPGKRVVRGMGFVALTWTLLWFSASVARASQPNLFSQKALVVDAKTNEVLVSRNATATTPIASITKLMTAMVVLDAAQPLDALVEISMDDFDLVKGSRSRLRMGTALTRREMLTIALMSSENRAANALCRAYPSGLGGCIAAMNAKAKALGMASTTFADPTGLSPNNLSTAEDLVKLIRAAEAYPLVRDYSIQPGHDVHLQPSGQTMTFGNSNGLVRNPRWNIALQKTGYIAEAGNCVVMSLTLAGKKVLVVLLDAAGRYSRFGDAHRIKTWMETGEVLELPAPRAVKRRPVAKNKKGRVTAVKKVRKYG